MNRYHPNTPLLLLKTDLESIYMHELPNIISDVFLLVLWNKIDYFLYDSYIWFLLYIIQCSHACSSVASPMI